MVVLVKFDILRILEEFPVLVHEEVAEAEVAEVARVERAPLVVEDDVLTAVRAARLAPARDWLRCSAHMITIYH